MKLFDTRIEISRKYVEATLNIGSTSSGRALRELLNVGAIKIIGSGNNKGNFRVLYYIANGIYPEGLTI